MKTTLPTQRTSAFALPILAVGLIIAGMVTYSATARASDPQRGLMLYETQCTGCHDSVFHLVGPRVAQTYAEVINEVTRWSEAIDIEWTNEEISDVADYLNTQFYKYPCQNQSCSSAQLERLAFWRTESKR